MRGKYFTSDALWAWILTLLAAAFLLGWFAAAAAGQQDDDGFKDMQAEAVDAKKEAVAAKAEQDKAYDKYRATKQAFEEIQRPVIGQAKPSAEKVQEVREAYQEAAKDVTQKTLAATAAQKRSNRLEREVTAWHAQTQGKPSPSAPTPNPLAKVNPRLGPTFALAQHLDAILQKTKGLAPPSYKDPRLGPEPIEIGLKKIQDVFEPGPRITQGPITPKPPPDVPKPRPVGSVVGSWVILEGYSAGEIVTYRPDGTWLWPGRSTKTWRQIGNQVEAVLEFNSPGLAGTCTYRFSVQGDQANGAWQCVVRQGAVDPNSGVIRMRRQ